jgi:gamma-glutamylcyclotransferase (GGCT)/AIG2-like uncharacterized protein YtfP
LSLAHKSTTLARRGGEAQTLVNQLDAFEASSHYWRKQVEISLGTHRRICWVYEPEPEFYSPRNLITSGDWIEYAKTKTDWPEDIGRDETQS